MYFRHHHHHYRHHHFSNIIISTTVLGRLWRPPKLSSSLLCPLFFSSTSDPHHHIVHRHVVQPLCTWSSLPSAENSPLQHSFRLPFLRHPTCHCHLILCAFTTLQNHILQSAHLIPHYSVFSIHLYPTQVKDFS
jgi:hypothetical protein